MVNPVSGRRNAGAVLARSVRELRAAGFVVEVEYTRGPGHAAEWAAGLDAETQVVVGVGGDGTIRELVDGMAGRSIPLAILPTGTENLVAKQFGFRFDARSLCERIRRGRPAPVDLGVANGRHFLVIAGVGFDAEVVSRLRAVRAGHITHASYFWPIWRTFWEHRFPSIRVEADDVTVHDGPGLVFVGNLPRYAIGLRICRDARWDDGELDLCIYPCRSRSRLAIHSVNTILARHPNRGGVIYRRCRTASITSREPIPLELDGDAAGMIPVDISVRPAHVRFLFTDDPRRHGNAQPQ